jgi:uncharacterized protein YacL
MIQAITRFVLVAAGLLGGYAVTEAVDWQAQLPSLPPTYVIFLFIILGGSMGFVLGGIVGRELTSAWQRVEERVSEVSGADLILGTLGLVIGLVLSFFASQPLRLLQPASFAVFTMIALTFVAGYLGVSVAMTRRREFAALFPALAPRDLRGLEERMLVIDTSAVIDARVLEMLRLGYLPGRLRVPRFVLAELQTLADSADDTRRSRGRRGLDLLATLPPDERVEVLELDYPDLALADEKLMRLCVEADAVLVTMDYNLTKVARVRGVTTLNLNEAAAALRPNFLPGDSILLHLTKPGKEAAQGVGYLEDGTMVVVQDGRALVGSETQVEVTSVLQTSAGRMIFARPAVMADAATEADG